MSAEEWLEFQPKIEDIIIPEEVEEEEEEPQIFEEYKENNGRFCKTLYYGRLPNSDRLSLPVTELCVQRFNSFEEKISQLDIGRAGDIGRETCSSPTSLVLALLYLDRLRGTNASYLSKVSSTDLFLISLMVASKYLHDDGEDDEVFNDEWATSGRMEKSELNKLELEFLAAIDWDLYASNPEFEATCKQLEWDVADKQVNARGWATYTDIYILSRDIDARLWQLLITCTVKVTAVCCLAYAASLMSMMATCHLVSKSTLLGPQAVQNSINTIFSSLDHNRSDEETQPSQREDLSAAEVAAVAVGVQQYIMSTNFDNGSIHLTGIDTFGDQDVLSGNCINDTHRLICYLKDWWRTDRQKKANTESICPFAAAVGKKKHFRHDNVIVRPISTGLGHL